MRFSRRDFVLGAAAGAAAASAVRPGAALAQGSGEAIRMGWLTALTGPGSSAGIGFDRGIVFAAAEINAAGGVKGRKIEVVTRDTQGDPTKAVNAAVEMVSKEKVHAIFGPVNSGEALATTPILARYKMPSMHPCVVDALMDTAKYPNAFRIAPSNRQWAEAAHHYCLDILKLKDVAVLGDTTGYGTTAVQASVDMLKKSGANVVHQALIEASQADVSADLIRTRDAGAKVILIWSVNGGYLSRVLNARGQLGWKVPVVGHPTLGSGEVKALLAKPEYWQDVFLVGYRSCSYDAQGKLPPRSQAFVERIAGKIALADTSLWWIACGYDAVQLLRQAVETTGSSAGPDIIKHWNGLAKYPGIFGDYTYTPEEHNGYPTDEVVMSVANSFRDGAFSLAPGYA